MALRLKRGMGQMPYYGGYIFLPSGGVLSPGSSPTPIGVAPAPADLTTPPASGADAAALQQQLADQALANQQAINAAGVQSSVLDQLSIGIVSAGDALSAPGGISWWVWLGLALGGFALATVGAGNPRRYGR